MSSEQIREYTHWKHNEENIWDNTVPRSIKSLEILSQSEILYSGWKRSSNFDTLLPRTFLLHSQSKTLLYTKDSSRGGKSIKGSLLLTGCIVERICRFDSGNGFPGLRIIKGKVFTEIFFKEEYIIIGLIEKLARFVSLRGLSNNYSEERIISQRKSSHLVLVRSTINGKLYVMKKYNRSVLKDSSRVLASVLNEIRILRSLNHSNIMTLAEVYDEQDHIVLITEYIDGGELRPLTPRGNKLSQKRRYHVMDSLLRVLNYLKDNKIMHRDIKFDNIILDKKTNEIKLIDFGIALETTQHHQFSKCCGTPGFIAPEVYIQEKRGPLAYDASCDIFGAGVIYYNILYGKHPFAGSTTEEVRRNNALCRFWLPSEDTLTPVERRERALVKSMMSPRRKDRVEVEQAIFMLNEIIKEASGCKAESNSAQIWDTRCPSY